MHNDSSSVSYHLGNATEREQNTESPLLPSICLIDVDNHAQAEDGDEYGVGGQARSIFEDGPFDAAQFERTIPDA